MFEKVLNAHSIQTGHILRMGENHGHWSRIKSALVNHFGHIPVLYGLVKDHKDKKEGEPLPSRPVCGADKGLNTQLSQVLAQVVAAIAMDMDEKKDAVCRSTEEMIVDIESVNERTDLNNLVIFSTDFEAYYPNFDIEEVAKVAKEEFINGDLDINVDEKELALYLAVTKERSELESLGLGQVTHTRLYTRGRKPGITTEEILERGSNTKSKFRDPERQPTEDEIRMMFGVALENLINTAMSNHLYSFNGDLRKQQSCGAIGNILTALGARLDDDDKIRIHEECVKADRDIPDDQRTAELFGQIANNVSSFVKVTVDYPSKNVSQWMPLLDLQVQSKENQIMYLLLIQN